MSLAERLGWEALSAGADPPLSLADLLDRPAWMADSACREHPELRFVPTTGRPSEAAVAVCAGCLVRGECGAYGRETGSSGMWGGRYLVDGRPPRSRAKGSGRPLLGFEAHPCEGCGVTIEGRRSRVCSPACRKRMERARPAA